MYIEISDRGTKQLKKTGEICRKNSRMMSKAGKAKKTVKAFTKNKGSQIKRQ
jgi:hypothetical protein